ncbi:MAG TPA: hypothetical protein VMW01_06515 [Williamwhitmania sp.]|jgi:hypothetical protein|nr:hypothetical protein [Williamwhitmania sp.]
MAIKTVLLLFIITILGQLSAFALFHNGNMELIIEPRQNKPTRITLFNCKGVQWLRIGG